MTFVIDLEKDEFDDFVSNHQKSHFLQSYTWGKVAKDAKNYTPYYVGLKDNGKLVAASLLLQKHLPLHQSYFYAPRGFVIDYDNRDLLKEFINHIKKFIKTKKALFVKIDPDIKLHSLDIDGHIIKDNIDNHDLVVFLKKQGFIHLGYNQNFEANQPRYTFRLNLDDDIDNIYRNFHSTTKKVLNRGNPFDLELFKNDTADIKDFYTVMNETVGREKIIIHSDEYYKAFYEILHENKMSDLYVVKVNIPHLKDLYQQKVNDLTKKSESLTSDTKRQEVLNQLEKAKKEVASLEDLTMEELPLSAIITVKYGNKVWTLHGGNHTLLRELNANYFIYYTIIQDAKKEGYHYIDFFGTTGNPTPDNPVYGIHLFKKRFNGEYLEFIGEFDLPTNRFKYRCFTTITSLYHKMGRIIFKMRHK